VQIQRIDLPGSTRAEARRVATRRKQELEQSEFGDEVFVSTLLVSERRRNTLWLISALREVCEGVDFEVTRLGLRVDRLVPHTLALGAMTRTLPPARSKGLTAVLWLDPDVGTCVIADERGWLFDRSISLKYAGDRLLHADDESADAAQEEDYHQVERLATELERTFTYVERQLGLGEVVRMRLCGIADGLDELARTLAANLRLEVALLGTARRGDSQPSIPPAAGAVLGAAMLPRPAQEANLLPPEVAHARAAARARRPLVAALGLASIMTLLAATVGLLWYQTTRSALASARSAAEKWEVGREGLEGQAALLLRADQIRTALSALTRPEPSWDALLVVLGAALPESLFIQRLEVRPEGPGWKLAVSLEGKGPSQSEVAAWVRQLDDGLRDGELFRVVALEPEGPPLRSAEGVSVRYRLVVWVAPLSMEDFPSG
jgi:hypothetical protein